MGLKVDVEATRYDMDGLVEAILQSVFGREESRRSKNVKKRFPEGR